VIRIAMRALLVMMVVMMKMMTTMVAVMAAAAVGATMAATMAVVAAVAMVVAVGATVMVIVAKQIQWKRHVVVDAISWKLLSSQKLIQNLCSALPQPEWDEDNSLVCLCPGIKAALLAP
jgi:hypothetical protein